QALELQPDHVAARAGLGVTLASMRKLPEAVAELRQAVRLRPDFAQAHHNLGVALAELGRLDEAVVCLRQALALQPDYAEAYYNLGNVLVEPEKTARGSGAIPAGLGASARLWRGLQQLGIGAH